MFYIADDGKYDEQVHSCRSEDVLAQTGREIKVEGRGDRSKKWFKKIVKS
jgi:hypothetical protein